MRGHGAYVSSRAGYRVTPALTAVGRCPNGPAVDSKPNVISRWTHRAFINRWNQAQRLTMLHSIAENLEAINPVAESAVRGPYHILWFTFHFLFFLKTVVLGDVVGNRTLRYWQLLITASQPIQKVTLPELSRS